MSRYLITKLDPLEKPPPDELHVRFTLELPTLHDANTAIDFALDYIKQAPEAPPTPIVSLLNLIRNFLPAPDPP